jgi:hypothetical protein
MVYIDDSAYTRPRRKTRRKGIYKRRKSIKRCRQASGRRGYKRAGMKRCYTRKSGRPRRRRA